MATAPGRAEPGPPPGPLSSLEQPAQRGAEAAAAAGVAAPQGSRGGAREHEEKKGKEEEDDSELGETDQELERTLNEALPEQVKSAMVAQLAR